MHYYYFNPFNKQYFFPADYKHHTVFATFYQAYTLTGKITWYLWRKSRVLRKYCLVSDAENIIPIENIKKYISVTSVLAFNRGTVGVEQKVTILGIDTLTDDTFFMKYAETNIARKNVNNEGDILMQLDMLDFVPKLLKHINEDSFTLIKTNVLLGKRLSKQNVDEQLLAILLELSKLTDIKTTKNYTTEVTGCFAHGDFCPWNIMVDTNRLLVFDWEMAGKYPIGYDLFTYIFQTSFLLLPRKSIHLILDQNQSFINRYFNSLMISDWKPYLIAFTNLKLKFETEKLNQRLLYHYKKLKLFLEI